MDQLEVARDGHGQVPRPRHTPAAWAGPTGSSIRLKLQLAENQQLIRKNRQLMRISDNSGHQGAVSGISEADVYWTLAADPRGVLRTKLEGDAGKADGCIRVRDATVAPTLPADSFSTLVVRASPGSAA